MPMNFTCDKEAERQLWAEACRRDFRLFALYAFGIRGFMREHPEKAWFCDRVHGPLCAWYAWHIRDWLLNRGTRTRRKKLMVVWPRGFGKTTLITKAGQIWLHLQESDMASVTDSVNFRKSEEFLAAIRDVLDGSNPHAWFTRLYGSWATERLWRSNALTHAARRSHGRSEASFEATSVEVGLTGKHPDAVFIDDPVVQEKLKEGDSWFHTVDDHVDALIPVVPSNGLVVASATRYADIDWLGRLMRDEGVKSIDGMAMRDPNFKLQPEGQWDLFLMRARNDAGKPTLPEAGWDDQALNDYEKKNPMVFAAQMMNEPGEGEHMPLNRAQIETMYVEEKDLPRGTLRYSVHIDTAFKDREKIGRGDYTVAQVWGHEPRTGVVYYIEGLRSNEWRSEEFGDRLVALLQRYRMQRKPIFIMTDEVSQGGHRDTFKVYLMGLCHAAGIPMPPFELLQRSGRRKEARIREAAMYWADGRVRLLRNAPEVQILVSEMLRIGVSANDDMADAAADVFNPAVYHPETLTQSGEVASVRPHRPWDEFLYDRTRSNVEAQALYDDYFEKLDKQEGLGALWDNE